MMKDIDILIRLYDDASQSYESKEGKTHLHLDTGRN